MLNVTKTYLPPLKKYYKYLKKIWASGQVTNSGPLVSELESKLKEYLGVKYVLLVNNGTIALQIALKALNITKEVITTPFSYVATTSSIVWENCIPLFVDIDERYFCIDTDKIEEAITPQTQAIMATHVYGNPCDVEKIHKIAKKHKLKVIYDAAHAFGVDYLGESLVSYGDISTLSFHATKLFHTVEGGALVTNNMELAEKIWYLRNFGHDGQEGFWGLGINGKLSEFHAAMGLCVLPEIQSIIQRRRTTCEFYNQYLAKYQSVKSILVREGTDFNYAYYPILLDSEDDLLQVKNRLNEEDIYPRRYFYPTLNSLPYVAYKKLPVAEDISSRVLCLPLSDVTSEKEVQHVCSILTSILSK
jgi:dTDP-4-amino-4,6-dideoxygalactose transaminase